MNKILLCIVFFASYVTAVRGMEDKENVENKENARHSFIKKPDEKKVKDFVIANIDEILKKKKPQYTYEGNTWEFTCSMNLFDEWKRRNKNLTISDMISSHNLILYPSVTHKEDDGTPNALKNNNYIVFIGNDGQIFLNLGMDRIN